MFRFTIQSQHLLFLFIGIFNISIQSQSNGIPNNTSDISFKLSIPLDAIEYAINENLPQVLLNDTSFSDNNNDQMKTKITKAGKLKLSRYNDYLMGIEIPLKVSVEKQYGAMGFYNSEKFNFTMKMYCTVSGKIDAKGNLSTETTILKFVFDEEPYINIAGVDISITALVEDELNAGKKEYAASIDKNIAENIPLQNMLLNLLQYFSKPFKASDEYNAWIDYECQKMQYTPFMIQNGELQTQINLVSRLSIYMNDAPMNTPSIKSLPFIESKGRVPTTSDIHSSIFIPKKQASLQANVAMAGETYELQDGKYSITLDSVAIESSTDELGILLETSGDFKGEISLSGNPVYDENAQTIFLSNPKFKAKSKNKLYEAALWIKKNSIQNQIAEKYGYPISENLTIIKNGLSDYLNTSYYDAIFLSGTIENFNIEDIKVSDYGIRIYYRLNYNLDIKLKSLKSF